MYLIGGRSIEPEDFGFTEALAEAHALRRRPRCMCKAPGIEMYVARLGSDYLIKRMPYTGNQHDPDCLSYEPPDELCDGRQARSAIIEDPNTGLTTVRVEFALSQRPGRAMSQGDERSARSVHRNEPSLSLRGLLHFLWNQAGLTRWRPEFDGKRNWATVRRLLLSAATSVIVKGDELHKRLFIPEVFTVERRQEIEARRAELLCGAHPHASGHRKLLMLCAEVKQISPSRHGCVAVIKHVPDQPFALDAQFYRRIETRFEREFSLWGAGIGCRILTLATFGMSAAGVPTIEELVLMPVDARWIPIRDAYDLRLTEHLVRERRRFIKLLSTDSSTAHGTASIVLTDVDDRPIVLRISADCSIEPQHGLSQARDRDDRSWIWRANSEAMPVLPPRALSERRTFNVSSSRGSS